MDFSRIGFIIFNIITPSIPEQIFYIYFTLYLLGKSEETRLKPANILKICIVSAAIATLSVLLRTYFPVLAGSGFLMIIGVIVTWGSVVFAYIISVIKDILRAFVCMILSFIVVTIYQTIYVPLLLYGTNTGLQA